MPSPQDIITNALRDLNILSVGVPQPAAEDLALGLAHYNRLVNRWAAQGRMSYYVTNQAFTFATSKQSYTIGVAANTPDFTISAGVRPPKIHRAKLVLTASSPASELDLPVIFVETYEGIPNPAQSGTQPYAVYYQPTYPNGTLWPVPYPTNTANQIRLYWTAQLNTVAIADIATSIDMPPALEDALTFTLEERLCIPFGKTPSPELAKQAWGARQIYSQLNDADPALIGTALRGGGNTAVDVYWLQSRGH